MFVYSGSIEVQKGESFGGGTVRIPFVFNSQLILSSAERNEMATNVYREFRRMLTDYDESRVSQYGDPIRIRFTAVEDVPHPSDDPYSGIPVPEPHVGR